MQEDEDFLTTPAEVLTATNAFRILGLEVSAPLSTIVARANELQTLLRINRVPSYPNDLHIFSPPDRSPEAIAAAAHRLEGPATRLRDEASWFHIRTPIDTAALTALREQNTAQAITLWARAAAQAPRPNGRLHYQHNLAVLRLCLLEIGASVSDPTPKSWEEVFSCWAPVLASDDFWQALVTASPIGMDPRCHQGTPGEIRDFVGTALARTVGRCAMHSVNAGNYQNASGWFALLNHGELSARFLKVAKDEVASSLVESIRAHIGEIDSQLKTAREGANNQKGQEPPSRSQAPSGEASSDLSAMDTALEQQLTAARTLLDLLIAMTSTGHPAVLSVTDNLAEAHQFVGVYYTNYRNDPERATQVTKAGLRFAVSDGVRTTVQRNLRVASWNSTYVRFQKAVEAKDYAKAEAAFKELEKLIDTANDAKVVQSIREPLSFLRLLRDGSPIKKAPSLSRINGFGTWLYGKSDLDAETGTYVSTLYFTALFVPLFVIARYRVTDAGGSAYHFFSKLRLTDGQRGWNVVVGLAISIALIFGMVGEQSKSTATSSSTNRPPATSAPYRAPPAPASPAPPSVSTSTRASLAAEIDRRRPLLELEQAQVDREAKAIDRGENALDSLRSSIEARRSFYPNGLPPAEYAQDQAEVEQYNRRDQALKARISQYNRRVGTLKQSIDDFNGLVRQHNAVR